MTKPILNAAIHYASLGFEVFPVHGIIDGAKCTCGDPGCGNPGKHPATFRGLLDATKDTKRIEGFFEKTQFNVAIRTGAESGIFVVDLDGADGESSLFKLTQQYGPLPETLHSITSRGRHLIFRHPGKKVFTRSKKLSIGPILGVDTRGDGGYIVAPPSKHESGHVYMLMERPIAEAPEWLVKMVTEEVQRAPQPLPALPKGDHSGFEWSFDDVRDMLAVLDPDMPYDDWLHVGMALKEGNYPIQIWDEWSRRGAKYKQGDCIKRYGKFTETGGITMGTLVDMAKQNGWILRRFEPMPLEIHPARAFIEKVQREFNARPPVDPFDLPPLMHRQEQVQDVRIDAGIIPGIVGETIKWIIDTAIKPQPELALLNVLAALGAVFGRRYATPINTRTNLYCVGLAGTGSGKDHSRKQIKELLGKAGLAQYIGSDRIKSGPGMLTAIAKQPAQVMHLDEFGLVLQGMGNSRANSYMADAARFFLELYSSSGSTYSAGQASADKNEPVVIHSPNLCIFGTSTVEDYASALNGRAITGGQLNRFIIMRVKTDIPQRRFDIIHQDVPQHIVDGWTRFKPMQEPGKLPENSMVKPSPIIVGYENIKEHFHAMQNHEDDKMREAKKTSPLWNRYAENALKVGMILAIARNPQRPDISPDEIEIAEAIVRQSIDFIVEFAGDYIAESEHEENCQDILRTIKRAGGIMSASEIAREVRKLDSRSRTGALAALEEQGTLVRCIDESETTPEGRKKIFYRINQTY